jgi:hypothetical protein
MATAQFPFFIVASQPVRDRLGPAVPKAAVLALRAILRSRKGLEVAHQQIRFGKHEIAFSSRIGTRGDLILNLDLGDPRLGGRLILESELRRAEQASRSSGKRDRARRRPAA